MFFISDLLKSVSHLAFLSLLFSQTIITPSTGSPYGVSPYTGYGFNPIARFGYGSGGYGGYGGYGAGGGKMLLPSAAAGSKLTQLRLIWRSLLGSLYSAMYGYGLGVAGGYSGYGGGYGKFGYGMPYGLGGYGLGGYGLGGYGLGGYGLAGLSGLGLGGYGGYGLGLGGLGLGLGGYGGYGGYGMGYGGYGMGYGGYGMGGYGGYSKQFGMEADFYKRMAEEERKAASTMAPQQAKFAPGTVGQMIATA